MPHRLAAAFRRVLGLALLLLPAVGTPAARAADDTWLNTSGNFLWDTTSPNWSSASQLWNNNFYTADTAVFGGTGAGTITVSPGINAYSLNFTAGGYTLNGGSLNFSPFGSGSLPAGQISVSTGNVATINSTINVFRGLQVTGGGTLQLGGTGSTISGWVPLAAGTNLAANVFIGSPTSTTFAGTLQLTSGTALPSNAIVGIGNAILDVGGNNVTLGGLVFANRSDANSTSLNQGVQGSGTVTLTGPIRLVGDAVGGGATINAPLSAGGGLLRAFVGSGQNGYDELAIVQPISNGSFLKTLGTDAAGLPSPVSTSTAPIGSLALYAANTFTGPTTINIGTNNVVSGSNASSALNLSNASLVLCGPGQQYAAATSVVVSGAATLLASNTQALGGFNGPPVAAADVSDRLGTGATLSLGLGTIQLAGSANAPASQTFAGFNSLAGLNRVTLFAGTGQTATLTVTGALTTAPGSFLNMAPMAATTATTTPAAVSFLFNGPLPAAVNGIIPGVYGSATTTVPADFVRNSATAGVGLVRLATADYSANTFGPTLNSLLSTAPTVVANTSANAIKTGVSITVNTPAVLSVGPGGILNTAAVTYGGTGTFDFGASPGLLTGSTSAITFSAAVTGTAGLYYGAGSTLTLSGNMAGLAGGLTNAGVGTLAVNTTTYTGPITAIAGTVTSTGFGGSGASGVVTLGGAALPAGTVGPLTTLNLNAAVHAAFARNLATAGSDGTAPFALTGYGNVVALYTGGPQTLGGDIALTTHLTLNAGTSTSTYTVGGAVSGQGALALLAGASAGATFALTSAASTTTGGFLIINSANQASTTPLVIASVAGSLGTGPVRFQGGTLQANFAGSLNGTGGLEVIASGVLNTNGNAVTLAGPIAGTNPAASLTKSGAGVLTLTAASVYPGTLAVSTGGLAIGGTGGSLKVTAALNLAANTTLAIDNSAGYNADRLGDYVPVTAAGGAVINYVPPTAATAGTAETIGKITASGTGTVFNVAGSTASPTVIHLGLAATSGGGTLTIRGAGLGTNTGNYTRVFIDGITTNQNVIPGVYYAATAGSTASPTPAGYSTTLGVVQFVPTAVTGNLIDNYAPTSTPITAAFTTTGDTTANTGASIYSLTLDAGSTLTLNNGGNGPNATNANTPTGTLSLSGGLLTAQNGAKTIQAGSASPAILDFGTATAVVTATSNLTVAAGVSLTGSGGLVKAGAGTLVLSGGTYAITGGYSVNAGILDVSALGPQTVTNFTGNGGTLQYGTNTLALVNTAASTSATTLAGTGAVTKSGSGTLTLAGSGAAAAPVAILDGVAALGANNALPTGPLTIGDATSAASQVASQLNLNGFNAAVAGLTVVARDFGNVPFLTGAGVLTVNGPIAYVNGTTPTIGFQYPTRVDSSVTAIDLGGAVRNLTVAGQGNGVNPGDLTIATVIQNGGLNITINLGGSAGTSASGITLSGATPNTYALGTTVNSGTVNVAATSSLGTGPVVLNSAGTVVTQVNLSGNQTIGSLSTVTVAAANLPSIAVPTGSTLTVNETADTAYAGNITGGNVAKTGNNTLSFTAALGYAGTTTVLPGLTAGGTLAFSGNGTALSAGSLTVGNNTALVPTVLFDNTAVSVNNRYTTTAAVTLNKGALTLAGNSAGTAQTLGGLSVAAGTTGNLVTVTSVGTSSSLTFASLAAIPAGSNLLFSGTALGQAPAGSSRVFFAAAPTLNAGGYIDNAFIDTPGYFNRATYDPTLGVKLFPASPNGSGTVIDNIGGPQLPTNLTSFTTTGTATATTGAKTGSLILDVGGGVTLVQTYAAAPGTGGGFGGNDGTPIDTLDVSGSLTSQNGPKYVTANTTGKVQVDGTGIVTTSDLTFAANVALVAPNGLTKTGAGILRLDGTNTVTGATAVNAGTLTVNGSLNAGTATTVNAGGTVAGSGSVLGNLTLNGGTANFAASGNVAGTLTVAGGSWNGFGSVTGLSTVSAGTFTLGSGARLTATGGLAVSGGTLAAVDSSSEVALPTGAVLTYSFAGSETFAGTISGAGGLTVNSGAATNRLTLTGNTTYTGPTTITSGILRSVNALSTPGGAVAIADGSRLEASGVVQRTLVASGSSGSSTGGAVLAVGNLTIADYAAPINFGGYIRTGAFNVQLTSNGPNLVRAVTLGDGAAFGSGTEVRIYNNLGGTSPGDTGVLATTGSSATLNGKVYGGTAFGQSAQIVGSGTLSVTGLLRGNFTFAGPSVVFVGGGANAPGFSPGFSGVLGTTTSPAAVGLTLSGNVAISANLSGSTATAGGNTSTHPVGWAVSGASGAPLGAYSSGVNSGNYYQYLASNASVTTVAGYNPSPSDAAAASQPRTTYGTIAVAAGTIFTIDNTANGLPTSSYGGSLSVGDSFTLIRTDSGGLGSASRYFGRTVTDTNGDDHSVIENFSYAPGSITYGGTLDPTASFVKVGLPPLPANSHWAVEQTSSVLRLYVAADAVPEPAAAGLLAAAAVALGRRARRRAKAKAQA